MEDLLKIDPLTGEKFTAKMISQKFANRKNQIKWNNIIAKKKRITKSYLDKPMDRNRNIMKKVLGNEKEVIKSYDYLDALGYDFNLAMYQIMINTETKKTAVGIYEFIIEALGNQKYKVYKNERIYKN